MDSTPKTRRRLSDAERVARLDSQKAMIEKRAREKKIERVTEAIGLLTDEKGEPMDPTLFNFVITLRQWITDRRKELPA